MNYSCELKGVSYNKKATKRQTDRHVNTAGGPELDQMRNFEKGKREGFERRICADKNENRLSGACQRQKLPLVWMVKQRQIFDD